MRPVTSARGWPLVALVALAGCGDEPGTFVDARAHDAADAPIDAAVDAVTDASIDAAIVTGCADGTREGLLDTTVFTAVAACAGTWQGDVSSGITLCSSSWHVCFGDEPELRATTYAQATAFPGCFAFDAAHDSFACHPDCSLQVAAGLDSAANIDLAAIGSSCPFQFPTGGSCLAGGRIDASENSGTGCAYNPAVTTGVVCCIDHSI